MNAPKTLFFVVVCLLVVCLSPVSAGQPASQGDPAYEILLLNGTLAPEKGVSRATQEALAHQGREALRSGQSRIHALIQLYEIPTQEGKASLATAGVDLLEYVPNFAWIAAIPAEHPEQVVDLAPVRWVGTWQAEDKLHPNIRAGSWGEWAIHPTEDAVMVVMQLHADVPLERGAGLAEAHGGVAMPPVEDLHGMTVWISEERLLELAGEEDVVWIEEGPAPLSPNNDGMRDSMHVDEVHAAPYNLDGSGVRIFVFDGGTVRASHSTFNPGSRVTVFDSSGQDNHPTHVAGTAAGDGNGGRALGVAPAATVISAGYEQSSGSMLFWDNAGDIQADYATARNTYNADLGTNSIGSNTAHNNYPCSREGDYGVSSNMLDRIVRGDSATVGSPVIMTWANGNERTGTVDGGTTRGRCGSNYVTTAPPSCAKNPIHIGAINSDYDSMTSFSSWGPCDDGRLKPIVSASGCELGRASGETYIYSSIATNNNAWGGMCGTSMSTPATAGVVALMIQEWRAQGYGGANDRPLPALVKAILVHTATDLGQDGPDYIYGYGEVNAQAAIDLILAGGGLTAQGGAHPENFGQSSINQGETHIYNVVVGSNTGELKVTLAWDDYAAAAYAGSAPVNNLNLELVAPDSTVYYPWVLNAAAPYQPASTGVNNLDNQEQVLVSDPAAGTWTIRVIGTTVPQAPQTYALVHSVEPPTYSPASCTEAITNGGFESGTGSWTLSGAQRVAAPAAGHGSYSLRLGGSTSSNHTAYQQVAIPADVARAELSFYWYMTTNEGGTYGHTWDYFYAEVRNTSGSVVATFDFRSDGWQQGQWMRSENIDLTPWAGQTMRVTFYATNDSVLSTSFYVDDVSLEPCDAPTSVDMLSFGVFASPEGIRIDWETAGHHESMGFNLYRSESPDLLGERLNGLMIPPQPPFGANPVLSYSFLDETAAPGETYYYTLEDLGQLGRSEMYGPVRATLALIYLPLAQR